MDADYAAEYEALYRDHWWWRARERFLEEELRRRVPAGGFGPMLDVGCGNGLAFPVLARYGEPEGVEPDATVVTAECARQKRIHRVPFDVTFQPRDRYGLVLFLDVLEHLDHPVEALAHARALLRPGGSVVVTVPAHSWLWTSHDDRNHHRRRYSSRAFETTARQAGLVPVARQYWFGWLTPVKLLVRAKEAVLGPSKRLHGVPPKGVNDACYLLARLERLVFRGALPIGTSLFFWLEPVESP